jgi:hypothetical protein
METQNNESSRQDKRKQLFLSQVELLKTFRSRNAIDGRQYEVSYNGLIEKMKITEAELREWGVDRS